MLVLVLAGVCINLVVVGFFIHHFHRTNREPYRRNVINYIHHLIDDLGPTPSLEKAREISSRYLLQISYESPELSWSTFKSPLEIPLDRWRVVFAQDGACIRHCRGLGLITVERGSGKFTFMLGSAFGIDPGGYFHIALMMALLTGFMVLAYAAIRWMLKPVTWLQEGVRLVGDGELDHAISGQRSDELGELVRAFNDMTGRIRTMLQARNRLLLDVSHEMRTPLTRMKVALALLPDGRTKESLHDDVVEMELMITTILEEARIRHAGGRIERQPIDLAGLLGNVLKEYENRMPGMNIHIPAEPEMITVDPELIKIVIRNIINNALTYSEPDGPPVTLALDRREKETMVVIQDYGRGIPLEDLPYIFEPFYRVDPSRSRGTGGYGIGLSLCKTIMDAHRGGIRVESEPGRGTTVFLVFPHEFHHA